MNLIGDQVTVLWYTTDVDGNAQNCDSAPTVTVTGPDVTDGNVTTTNPATGTYASVYEPGSAGRYTFELDGVLDTLPEYGAQTVTVHDGLREGQGGPFPAGLQSWDDTLV